MLRRRLKLTTDHVTPLLAVRPLTPTSLSPYGRVKYIDANGKGDSFTSLNAALRVAAFGAFYDELDFVRSHLNLTLTAVPASSAARATRL